MPQTCPCCGCATCEHQCRWDIDECKDLTLQNLGTGSATGTDGSETYCDCGCRCETLFLSFFPEDPATCDCLWNCDEICNDDQLPNTCPGTIHASYDAEHNLYEFDDVGCGVISVDIKLQYVEVNGICMLRMQMTGDIEYTEDQILDDCGAELYALYGPFGTEDDIGTCYMIANCACVTTTTCCEEERGEANPIPKVLHVSVYQELCPDLDGLEFDLVAEDCAGSDTCKGVWLAQNVLDNEGVGFGSFGLLCGFGADLTADGFSLQVVGSTSYAGITTGNGPNECESNTQFPPESGASCEPLNLVFELTGGPGANANCTDDLLNDQVIILTITE